MMMRMKMRSVLSNYCALRSSAPPNEVTLQLTNTFTGC